MFVNGVLVIDLGGVHQRLPGKRHVDGATGTATNIEGGIARPGQRRRHPDSLATPARREPITLAKRVNATGASGTATAASAPCRSTWRKGSTYEIAVFSADGHPTESNFQLTLSGFATNQPSASPAAATAWSRRGEECDCGDGTGPMPAGCDGPNADGVYGGCTTQCKFGPFCGDNIVNGPEKCDLGRNNGTTCGADGCTYGCTKHYCGDGIVDPGEVCDLGPLNGHAGPALFEHLRCSSFRKNVGMAGVIGPFAWSC